MGMGNDKEKENGVLKRVEKGLTGLKNDVRVHDGRCEFFDPAVAKFQSIGAEGAKVDKIDQSLADIRTDLLLLTPSTDIPPPQLHSQSTQPQYHSGTPQKYLSLARISDFNPTCSLRFQHFKPAELKMQLGKG